MDENAKGAMTDKATTGDASAPQTGQLPQRPRARGRKAGKAGLWLLLSLVLVAGLAGFAVLGLTGSPIRLPVWAVAEVETRLNRALGDAVPDGALSVGGIEVAVDDDWVPRLRLEDVRLMQQDGKALLTLPETRLSFDPTALLDGHIRPRSLRVIGARVSLRRGVDGSFDFALGAGRIGPPVESMAQVFDLVDRAFALPVLSRLQRIEAEALTLTLTDARANRTWQVGDGRLTLENRESELAAELGLSLVGGGETPAQAVLTIVSQKGDSVARVTAMVDRVAAADIAAQAAPLALLGVLDAPISGRIATTLGADGITALEGSLELGPGALRPTQATRPVPFDRARLDLGYDPARGRINLTALEVESTSLRLKATGHAYLQDAAGAFMQGPLGGRLPAAFLTQVRIDEAMVDPEGLFKEPIRFSEGAFDLRVRLDPFALDIGQVALVEDGHRLTASGVAAADPDGWRVALDVHLDEIRHDRLLALWPVSLVPKTREWLAVNLLEGTMTDVRAAVRLRPGTEPRLSLGYDFTDTDVRFIKTLPPIRAGTGYATIDGQTYTLVLSKGTVTPPMGGVIDVAGSVFSVLDITKRPAQSEIRLKTRSSLTAALSLLDEPPFRFMTKAGRPVDLGTGDTVMDATFRLPLVPRVKLTDVSYQVTGRVRNFASDKIVANKVLTAPELTLTADPRGMRIGGAGLLGAIPFDVIYTIGFGPDARGKSRVEGSVTLSPETVTELGLGLPEGAVTGSGAGQITIDLEKGKPGQLRLVSDLNRIGLTIPGTGWSKAQNSLGLLEVDARLGQPPVIDRIALSGPGFAATGTVTVQPGGGLETARLDSVKIGEWLNATVELTGRGKGRPVKVAVTGGRMDLRRLPDRPGTSAPGGDDAPLQVALDRVVVSEGISLTRFRGAFTQGGGFSGTFAAAVNDASPITGTVVPTTNGSAVRLQSDDAGGVLAAAGIFKSARGGQLDLRLTPLGPKGVYDGVAEITRVRVVDAPVLAELLSAVSIVGLLEQLNGEGLLFNKAQGAFRITPAAIEVTRGSAVGASLGVSMAGVYGTAAKELALQGVVSPLYLLNGIGAGLTRRGEGVFGFNYALRGTADRPLVSVNPLSILTPGMFREIFRRPAPTLGNGG
jgi:hypothetical protein